jgi:hypothetical protein
MALDRKTRSSTLAVVTLCACAFAAPALADSDATRAEARERFDRGLRLFNQRDDSGALAEFERAYELTKHPLVLYNMALVYAAMNRPVEAVETLDKLLSNPGSLDKDKLERARQAKNEQASSIGALEIVTNVAGASIEIDGVVRGKTPLAKPLRLGRGAHIVGAIAAGRIPVRREVLIPSGGTAKVELELLPSDGRLAEIEVETELPGAQIEVDGQRVGTTPLAAPITLAPGKHSVEVKRVGYRSVVKELNLGPGTKGRVKADMVVDASKLSRESGTLNLEVSETSASTWLDGNPIANTARVPHGEHVLRVERAGFLPFERTVNVPRGSSTLVRVELEPTPETRAAYVDRTTGQRTWGWVAVGGGAVIALGGAGFLIWNGAKESDAEKDFDTEADKHEPGGECDAATGNQTDECKKRLELALADLEDVRAREKFGWIGLGVGAAAAAFGAFLLISNDDPERYEPSRESDVFGRLRVAPVGWTAKGGGGFGVIGSF